jgi:transposase-like protein
VNEIASANGISPNLLFRWKSKAVSRLPQVFKKETEKLTKQRQAFEAIIAELYRQIGKLSTEGWNGLKKIWLSS